MRSALQFPTTHEHPIDRMLLCHERIRRFLDGAERLAALADPADPRGPEAARSCARYFREGLPLHAQDEDATLAPRLRPLANEALDHALDTLASDHHRLDQLMERLLPELDTISTGAPVAPTLTALVSALRAQLEPHLALEEELVFPLARAQLSPAQVAEILQEMAERRR